MFSMYGKRQLMLAFLFYGQFKGKNKQGGTT